MAARLAGWGIAVLSIATFCGSTPRFSRAAAEPATQPAGPAKTGAFDITFTERSPLSSPEALAKRLSLKPKDVADDYDISKRPFRIYVPANYDAATPCGIFVYLGYKDSVATPPLWKPFLDQSHLIFITSVCHTGNAYPNSVPTWQTVGLAFDAVFNLKQKYAIDDRRIYLMSFTTDAMSVGLSTADVFDGFVDCFDSSYFRPIKAPNGGYWPPLITAPQGGGLMADARTRAFFLIDPGDPDEVEHYKRLIRQMKDDGFAHLTQASLSSLDDLHYPNFKLEWFRDKALPFLDGASADEAKHRASIALEAKAAATAPSAKAPPPPKPASAQLSATQASPPPSAPAQAAVAEPSPAQHLLTMAKLDAENNRPDAAKDKLQQIIDTYPDDPAAAKAKELLQQLNNQ